MKKEKNEKVFMHCWQSIDKKDNLINLAKSCLLVDLSFMRVVKAVQIFQIHLEAPIVAYQRYNSELYTVNIENKSTNIKNNNEESQEKIQCVSKLCTHLK